MKKVCSFSIVLFLFICFGCDMDTENFYETDQANYKNPLQNNSYRSTLVDPILVEAVVLEEDIYEGGSSSFDTWPHRRFILKVISDQSLPKKRVKKFKYHTANLDSSINIGDVLLFVFDKEGKLYEVVKRELAPCTIQKR